MNSLPLKKAKYKAEIIFLSCLGLGFFPWAPGTLASLATLPLLYGLTLSHLPSLFLIPMTILLIAGSGLIAQMIQKSYHVHDPPWIVIDEVIGMLVAFIIYPHPSLSSLLLLFIFFRFFDISKLWPAQLFDQKITHGIGVILDDVVAGLYAGVATRLIHSLVF